MALNFLAGLGQAAMGFQQGYDRSEDREIAKKNMEEDRAYARQQRQFQAAQQQRALDEQKREDEFRAGLQGVQTTETIENPATQTIYGNQAPVVRDEDGNLMPGAVETPAQKVTRQRNKEDVYADYAAMATKAGKMDQALKFNDMADQASHQRAATLFQQWSASTADNANLYDAATQAAKIYNNDRLPGKVKGIQQNGDGSITVQMFNSSTGATLPRTFKSVEELKQGLEGYYSPETYNAYIKSKRDAAIKSQEEINKERAKGYVVAPGAAFMPGAGDTRKPFVNDNGMVWNGDYNPDGSPTMVKPGKGTGPGAGKSGDVPKAISEGLKGNEGLIPAATTISFGLQQNNPGMPDHVANALAVNAAKGTNMTRTFNPQTGMFERHYTDKAEIDPKTKQPIGFATGKTYLIDSDAYKKDGSISPDEAKSAVEALQKNAPDAFAQYAAAVTPEGFKAFDTKMEQSYNTMVANAKQAAEKAQADQQAAIKAGDQRAAADAALRQKDIQAKLDAGLESIKAEGRKLQLVREFYKPPAPAGTNAAGRNTTFNGGLNYTPDSNSPAGKVAARRAEQQAAAAKKEQGRLAAQQALSKQFQIDKNSMDPVDLVRKYNDADLPTVDMAALRAIKY